MAPTDAQDLQRTAALFHEYAASLAHDLGFQGFAAEMRDFPAQYAAPRGSLCLALIGEEAVGCCALRPLDDCDYAEAAEMKRLYVRPAYRGLGLGRALTRYMLDQAQLRAYRSVLLDTLSEMETARALYEELGFVEIPPYYHNPIAGAHYLKVDLH